MQKRGEQRASPDAKQCVKTGGLRDAALVPLAGSGGTDAGMDWSKAGGWRQGDGTREIGGSLGAHI